MKEASAARCLTNPWNCERPAPPWVVGVDVEPTIRLLGAVERGGTPASEAVFRAFFRTPSHGRPELARHVSAVPLSATTLLLLVIILHSCTGPTLEPLAHEGRVAPIVDTLMGHAVQVMRGAPKLGSSAVHSHWPSLENSTGSIGRRPQQA